MDCPVCKGSGVLALPHAPTVGGGWLDQKYVFSETKCGACGGSGEKSGSFEALESEFSESERVRSVDMNAEEQFEMVRRALVTLLRESSFLPRNTINTWIGKTRRARVGDSGSIETFRDVQAEFEWLRPHCKPPQMEFTINSAKEAEYEAEMAQVGSHLHFLVRLATQVERLVQRNPWSFGAE